MTLSHYDGTATELDDKTEELVSVFICRMLVVQSASMQKR
jgi:hypothetical protein